MPNPLVPGENAAAPASRPLMPKTIMLGRRLILLKGD
jgi:hypothetical protein